MSSFRVILRHTGWALSLLCLSLCLAPCAISQSAGTKPQAAPAPPSPSAEQLAIEAASAKERRREMDVLGIKSLRPGVSNTPGDPNYANYDESRADLYPNIPDPLLLTSGRRVTTPEMWWKQRRPQIAALFDHDVLGVTPAHTPSVHWEVVKTEREKNGDIPVITKTLVGHVDNSADPAITVNIDLTLTTPAGVQGPVPVILELGFSKEFMAMLLKRFPQFAALAGPGPSWQQQVLAKGWGYAEYVPTSVQADNGAGLDAGIIGLVNKGRPRSMTDWGALKAWAWGASRCIDYFETDPAVDARQIGIEGHSRYGKAALVAMAYDPRFAIGYISSSGEAGAKLYRHIYGEEVGNIAAPNEFHWMAGNFLRYDGPLTVADLPVDNHELIALVAPRPVFISGGSPTAGDGWVDAKGMFLAAAGAGPVYRLLGKKDMGATTFPPIEAGLIDGDIAFRQHSGGHTPSPNWPTFIEFAGRYLHAPGPTALTPGSPVPVTAESDRERMMALLGLSDKDMRPLPAGDPKAPNATNYDEAKANVYPNLPDPLTLKDGKPVTTPDIWWHDRRPQILRDYEHEVLGYAPPNLPGVHWQVLSTTPETYGGVDVVAKHLIGHVDNAFDPRIAVNIELVVFTPARAAGPVPALLELAFDKDFDQALAGRVDTAKPGTPGHWDVNGSLALARGWGFAVLKPTSIQPDNGAGLTAGIIGLMNSGRPRGLLDWGALSAWSWGASRALDYLQSDPAIDGKQVGILGHSRFGKTALVAAALDPRFAIVYSSSSGEGGAKLYRHIFGEQMPNVAGPSLYHWFDGNFLRYGGPLTPADLPVDNHELIALCAPRPVFIGGGSSVGDGYAQPNGDAWADAEGMFLAEVHAGPVYRLLGAKDLGTTTFPPIETTLDSGDLAFRQHPFGHTPAPNWPAFLDFAKRYLHAAQ